MDPREEPAPARSGFVHSGVAGTARSDTPTGHHRRRPQSPPRRRVLLHLLSRPHTGAHADAHRGRERRSRHVFGRPRPGAAWVHLPITMGYDRYPELLIDEKKALLE